MRNNFKHITHKPRSSNQQEKVQLDQARVHVRREDDDAETADSVPESEPAMADA